MARVWLSVIKGFIREEVMSEYGREMINKENWKEAFGVIAEGTNSALASRDYNVPCCSKHCIIIIQGYHIWWCSAHYQPKAWCEKGRLKLAIKRLGRK